MRCKYEGCSSLASATIGNSVKSIGGWVFEYCTSLATLYSLNTTPPSAFYETFVRDAHAHKFYYEVILFVPNEALKAYQTTEPWRKFWYPQGFDPTGIESVKSDAMNGNNIYYDLRGNRLDAPKKGLNIINGKKVIVK